MTTIPAAEMPVPRLELRWQKLEGDARYTIECIYLLVLPLRKYDIRAERVDDSGNDLPSVHTLDVTMGNTRSTGTLESLHDQANDTIRTPFRDHSHAIWDSHHLGSPPIFVTAGDRAMQLVET